MKNNLLLNALSKYLTGFVIVALLLFLPAGTLNWFNGWLFCGLLFIPMFFLGVVLLLKAPDLLRKRLKNRETQTEQKQVIGFSLLMFLAGFLSAGLDFRFGWTTVPDAVIFASSIIFVASYGMYAEVMRENAYLSRTIEVQEGQKVIDSGLYGIVRHPMYSATTLLFLSIPLVLGSWIAFAIFLLYLPLIAKRIRNEETVLEEGLIGYKEYKQKVKYKMFPFVW